jgi:DNA-binding transcriptional regulator LsrR (DeoR family)
MSKTITQDQVVEAAGELDQEPFTRAQVAERLGVKTTEIKQGFKEARRADRVEKVGDDAEGTGQFRLTDK